MVVIHHLLQEIVDVQFCPAIDDSLHLVEQFLEVDALSNGNIVKGTLVVDVMDDFHLHCRTLGHRPNTQVFGTLNLVLLTMTLDEFHKFLSELAGLAGTYALHLLQFFERNRVNRGHLF